MGGLAQLGEHLLCKQGVVGSIPSTSTNTLEKHARTYIQAIAASVLAFADKQFFKNMEEVKKVIHAQALTGRPVGVSV